MLHDTGLLAPKHGTATTFAEAREIAATIGYPVLVRPSYVLGGRGMEIVYDDATLEAYIAKATDVSPEHPVLVDRFLEDAVEIDVDALYDGTDLYLGGVMEHIEEAGIHSGDSACALPPITLGSADLLKIRAATEKLAARIGVRGLMNVQYAIKDDILYVIEANPRASPHGAVRVEGDGGAAGQGRGPDRGGGDDRRRCGRPACCRRPATAPTCPRTCRSRSRRRCCPSTGSAPSRATASTPCSARR